MRISIIAGLLVLLSFPAGGNGLCRGDFNGDGQVKVDELLVAVNNALDGCGPEPTARPTFTATPTRRRTPTPTPRPQVNCPYTFRSTTNNVRSICGYGGVINDRCGGLWAASFFGDGDLVIVPVVAEDGAIAFFGGEVTSSTRASLMGWWTEPDVSDLELLSGSIQLNSSGDELLVNPNWIPFTYRGCQALGYAGIFVDMVDLGSGGGASGAAHPDPKSAFDAFRRSIASDPPEIGR